MRPGCGLKFREGWFHTRHTPPSAPTSGGIDPTAENPKASSTVQTGKGALGPGSLCELCPEGRKEVVMKKKRVSACIATMSCAKDQRDKDTPGYFSTLAQTMGSMRACDEGQRVKLPTFRVCIPGQGEGHEALRKIFRNTAGWMTIQAAGWRCLAIDRSCLAQECLADDGGRNSEL